MLRPHGWENVNLRWRLTLFYGTVLSAILVIGGTALYFSLRSSLYGLLNEGLRGAVNAVAQRFALPNRRGDAGSKPFGGRRGGPDDLRPRLSGDATLTLYDSSGNISNVLEQPPVNAPLIEGISSASAATIDEALKNRDLTKAQADQLKLNVQKGRNPFVGSRGFGKSSGSGRGSSMDGGRDGGGIGG